MPDMPNTLDEEEPEEDEVDVARPEEAVEFEITCPVCLRTYHTTRADILAADAAGEL